MEGGAKPEHRSPCFVSKPNHTQAALKFLLFFLNCDQLIFREIFGDKRSGAENG